MWKIFDNKQFISPTIPMAMFLVATYLAMWIVTFFNYTPDAEHSEIISGLLNEFGWLRLLLIFLTTALNLLLIANLNSRYSIIRTRSFAPIFLFALLSIVWKDNFMFVSAHFSLFIMIIGFMLFMGMYKNRKATEASFLGTLLFSCLGFLNTAYLVLIPVIWLGFIIMKSFSLKVFLASLIGAMLPWIFFASGCWYYNFATNLPEEFIKNFEPGLVFTDAGLYEKIYIGFLLLVTATGLMGLLSNMMNDSVQTRKNMYLIILFTSFLLLITCFFPHARFAFLPLTAFGISFILAHPFTLNKSPFYKILLLVFIVVNLIYFSLNFLPV
jgi:hypothetical protein